MEKQLIEAICAADQSRAEARCGVGKGIEDKVAFNRRFRMKNGLTFTHPGQLNPDIVEPAGPIDPEVGVVGVWNKRREMHRLRGQLRLPRHVQPRRHFRQLDLLHGTDDPRRYGQGLRGRLPARRVRRRHAGEQPESQRQSGRGGLVPIGRRTHRRRGGQGAVDASRGDPGPGRCQAEILAIKRRVPSPERREEGSRLVQQPIEKVGPAEWTFAKEIVLLDAKLAKEPVAQVEVQAIQVGPAVFIGNPAESLSNWDWTSRPRARSSSPSPWRLANDCVGYVPTEEAFGPHGGGYETRLTSYSNLEITAGTKIVEAGVELARQMKPGIVPEPRKAPPFQGQPVGLRKRSARERLKETRKPGKPSQLTIPSKHLCQATLPWSPRICPTLLESNDA